MIISKDITRYRCSKCGSTNVSIEAICKWDEQSQRIDPVDMSEGGHLCDDCGKTCDLITQTGSRFSSCDNSELRGIVIGVEYAGLVCSPISNNSIDVYEKEPKPEESE